MVGRVKASIMLHYLEQSQYTGAINCIFMFMNPTSGKDKRLFCLRLGASQDAIFKIQSTKNPKHVQFNLYKPQGTKKDFYKVLVQLVVV